jgi:hypothetical protein
MEFDSLTFRGSYSQMGGFGRCKATMLRGVTYGIVCLNHWGENTSGNRTRSQIGDSRHPTLEPFPRRRGRETGLPLGIASRTAPSA